MNAWMKILTKVNDNSITKIYKQQEYTMKYVTTMLRKLELSELIYSKKLGREKIYSLTDKGLDMIKLMGDIKWDVL